MKKYVERGCNAVSTLSFLLGRGRDAPQRAEADRRRVGLRDGHVGEERGAEAQVRGETDCGFDCQLNPSPRPDDSLFTLLFIIYHYETMKMKIEKAPNQHVVAKIPMDHPLQRQPHPPLRRPRGRQTDTRVPSRTTQRAAAAAGRAHRGARRTGVRACNRRPRRRRRQPSLRTMESGKLYHLIAVILAERPCWCIYLGCTLSFSVGPFLLTKFVCIGLQQ